MIPLRGVLAEWQLVRARLVRSRLGLWLLLLEVGFVWLALGSGNGVLAPLALRTAMLAAVLGVAFTAGSAADRAALALTLTHPTTPVAVAAGRWLAAVTPAVLVTLGGSVVAALARGWEVTDVVRAALPLAGAAGAVAACALLAVWVAGNGLAAILFFYIALVGGLTPTDLAQRFEPGVVRSLGAALLSFAPSPWRYDRLAAAAAGAWLHAAAWVVSGVGLASFVLRRRAS